MRYAIPVTNGELAAHFGHCEQFAFFDIDEATGTVISRNMLPAPEHQPGLLPAWLAKEGVTTVIAGGMGSRAQELFMQNRIDVIVGAPAGDPEQIVMAHLQGSLTTGDNVCDH